MSLSRRRLPGEVSGEINVFFTWHRISNRLLDIQKQSSRGKEQPEVRPAQ